MKSGAFLGTYTLFFSLIHSLDITLREQDVRDIVERDGAILSQIRGLKESLGNCRDVLTELMVKHEKLQTEGGFTVLQEAKVGHLHKGRGSQFTIVPRDHEVNSKCCLKYGNNVG